MSTLAWLQTRKAWQLKYACFLTGLPMTGSKAELAHLLDQSLAQPEGRKKQRRIVSVDMGIRNLAICVLDAPHVSLSKRNINPSKAKVEVVAWEKIDVLSHVTSTLASKATEASASPVATKSVVAAANFTPSVLAEIACTLTGNWLKTYVPDQILIERQRFRSGGGAAVQEWTLRVNMLESMLWASLQAFRISAQQSSHPADIAPFPTLAEVSPARVASFWCSSPVAATRQPPQDLLADQTESEALWNQVEKRKVEKKDKIAVVREWLSPTNPSPEAILGFTSDTQLIINAFLAETKKRGRRRIESDQNTQSRPDKLDDLADCLLQAIAFTQWESNRVAIRDLIHKGLSEKS